jgi:hypothetical protein
MRVVCVALLALAATSCGTVEASKPSVEVDMRNVDLHITPQIDLQVRHLRGRFVAAGTRPAPYLDDPRTYTVAVDSGEVAVEMDSLNAIMTRALEQARSNVRRVRISVDEHGQLRQNGVVKKGISVPFDMKASVGVTPDGLIRIHTESVKGLRSTGQPAAQGAAREDRRSDSCRSWSRHPRRRQRPAARRLAASPTARLSRPADIRARRSRCADTSLRSGAAQPISPTATAKNHIYWRGGQLAFGKLTMTETDLELVDEDPQDSFDFSVDRWNEQLVAGYSKTTADRGLRAHMPDYNDLHPPVRAR